MIISLFSINDRFQEPTDTMITISARRTITFEYKIAFIYFLTGFVWIYLSDTFFGSIITDKQLLTELSIYKGVVYVLITSVLLFYLVRRHMKQLRLSQSKADESEQQFRTVLESVSLIGLILDVDGNIALCNAYLLALTGWQREDILGKNWFTTFLPPELQKNIELEVFQRTLALGELPAHFENEIITRSGERRTIAWSNTILRDHNNAIINVASIGEDVTDRKYAEEELRRSATRSNLLVDILQFHCESVEEYLDYALNRAIEITKSTIGFIYEYSEEKQVLTLNSWPKAVMHEPPSQERQQSFELNRSGIWGEAVRQRTAVMINEVPAEYSLKDDYPERNIHIKNYLSVPVMNGDRIVGVVAVANNDSPYNETDIRQLSMVLEIVWKVVEHKRVEIENKIILQTTMDGFYLVAADGRIIDANSSYSAMIGYSRDELLGMSVKDVEASDTEDAIQQRLSRIMETGSDRFETTHKRKDGKVIDIEASVNLLHNQERLFCFLRETTERKRSEQLLAQEKERLAVTLRSIGDGVITTDVAGKIIMLNKAAEEMTGWTSEDAAGRPLPEVFMIINELTREVCENPVEKVMSTGNVIELANHTCLISKDGRELVIADSGAPIRDNDSRIAGVVLVFRDMTEKQKLIDSIQRAQKLESIGILAGGIAHDFNNMLAGIFGYLDLAKEHAVQRKTDHVLKYLEKAIGVFERAKGLTQQLLTFSKGGAPIRKTMHIGPLIRHSVNFALSGSNVTCQFPSAESMDTNSDLWACDCDESQMGQVIDNIAINAMQAMPMGGKISVAAVNVTNPPGHPGNFVKVSVQDQGAGIPNDVLPKIFDPFFSTKATGHGLGLATVYSIVQRHDGWIDVESKHNVGTTFHIFIPASRNEKFSVPVRKAASHQGAGKVLILDDEDFIREIAGTMLQSMGYTIALAKDGQEALSIFEAAEKSGAQFAVTILDMTIPGGVGGKDIAQAMRNINPDTVIIASSGYSEDPIISNPRDYGFTDRIIKPYRKNELMELMTRVLPPGNPEPGVPEVHCTE
jgi:PAS domain S-box-containing protein